jgi:ACS family D-galactonate transporter-like MFS transporter
MIGIEEQRTSFRAFAPALALLAASFLINYIDRGNLGVAAPLLKGELHISGSQLGLLLAAFFWTYTGLQFVVGWAVDRFDVNRVLATGFLLWSLATVATGLVGGFVSLLLVRLVLGIGESVAVPSYSKILARHLPEDSRGFGNGVIGAGQFCGPAVGIFGAGLLMARYGWRPVFVAIGLVSLLWLPAWQKWMPRGEGICGPLLGKCMSVRQILRNRSFWGASAGQFCETYFLYFLVMWLPFYLTTERHLVMTAMATVAGVYYALAAVASLFAGWQSDTMIHRGASLTVVRKATMLIGHTTAAIGLAGCCIAGPKVYLGYLALAGVGLGIAYPGISAFAQTLAGPESAGRWMGMQNGFGNFGGVVSPALAGFLLDRTGDFTAALMITSAVMLAGGFAWVFGVGRLEPVCSGLPLTRAATDLA